MRSLLEASRNASGMTRAISRIQTELRNEQYAQSLLPDRPADLDQLKDFVDEVANLHSKSLKELEKLSDRLGLTTVKVPENIAPSEQEYLKLLINLQVQKQVLWLNLQSYQDEIGPVKQASGRGGRSGILGTTKLATIGTALKSKSSQVTHSTNKFNKLVNELQSRERPQWAPEGLVPPKLLPEQVLRLSQDDPLWEEVFGGTPWIQEFQTPNSTYKIPDYAKSRPIREGILSALLLERVVEQRARIQSERINIINEWVYQLYAFWECHNKSFESPLNFRIREKLKKHLFSRPDYLRIASTALLWRKPVQELWNEIQVSHPVELWNCGIPLEFEDVFSDLLRIPDDFDDAPYDQAQGQERKLEDDSSEESDGDTDIDEEERERQLSKVYRQLSTLDIEETSLRLPPVRKLIDQVQGVSSTTSAEERNSTVEPELPSVGVLLETVDGIRTSDTPMFNFYGESLSAALTVPGNRVSLPGVDRYYNDMKITPEMLRTLDEGRHLHFSIVTVSAKLLEFEIQNNPLRAVAPIYIQPRFTVANIHWHEISFEMIVDVAMKVLRPYPAFLLNTYGTLQAPKNLGTWLVLVPLPSTRSWCLAIMEVEKNKIQLVTENKLTQKDRDCMQVVREIILLSHARNSQSTDHSIASTFLGI